MERQKNIKIFESFSFFETVFGYFSVFAPFRTVFTVWLFEVQTR